MKNNFSLFKFLENIKENMLEIWLNEVKIK